MTEQNLNLVDEVKRRRTFAIISHPDAGKTTLTEKFLLYGGAIREAGSVKSRKSQKHAVSDWMEIEKQRGISVASSVLQFEYNNFCINILDTPGHQDFSEDTYRTLMAADSAVMVIDSAKGVEDQTKKLFHVCKMRGIPIFTFINKMDRQGKDPFELLEDIENVLRSDAGGIGLFRSEFLYMEMGSKLPSEEQLFQVYKLAAESMGANRVVVRIADFGGDKMVESVDLGEQANPAIGLRGIRIMMEKEELFLPQFRAILRASALGNVSIMFPMVTSMEEVAAAKALLEKAKKQLKDEKTAYNENIEIGVMIETPAAVMISGELAREVDFFSIGTNDLLQLTLGMDRENPKLDKYYNPYHPALMKMIRIVANNVHLEGKRISICGDLAADLSMTEFFVQIGIDELSVAPHQVLGLRKKIREIQ